MGDSTASATVAALAGGFGAGSDPMERKIAGKAGDAHILRHLETAGSLVIDEAAGKRAQVGRRARAQGSNSEGECSPDAS